MNIDSFIFLAQVRQIALKMPGVSEGICYGTPGFYVGKKLFARMKEEGDTLVVYSPDRDIWMKKDPRTFFITPHYQNYSYVLVNLARVNAESLEEIISQAWKSRATKTLIKQFAEIAG